MIGKILIGIIAWLIGIFGWVQIIGSIQNLGTRKGLPFIIALWIIILIAFSALFIIRFDGLIPLAIGYVVSLVQVIYLRRKNKNN